MRAETISDILDLLDDDLIAETDRLRKKRKNHKKVSTRLVKWTALAACICLILVGTVHTLLRFDYFRAGCSAMPGTIVNGLYYYNVSHDGVYAYCPGGESQKLLSTCWEDGWLVNDYGLYYMRGKSLYVRPHGGHKSVKLHTAKGSTHISFLLQPDGNVIVTAYNKHKELIRQQLLDGKTGDLLKTVMEPTPYDVYYKLGKYSDLNYSVGSRKLLLSYVEENTESGLFVPSGFGLFENGENILPEDIRVYKGSSLYSGHTLILSGYREKEEAVENKEYFLIILTPDGNDRILAVQNRYYLTGTDSYLFYSHLDGVWCLSLEDGSYWELEALQDSAVSFYDFSTDGQYLYSCAPWDHIQECWLVEYNDTGRPVRLVLIDEDITH